MGRPEPLTAGLELDFDRHGLIEMLPKRFKREIGAAASPRPPGQVAAWGQGGTECNCKAGCEQHEVCDDYRHSLFPFEIVASASR